MKYAIFNRGVEAFFHIVIHLTRGIYMAQHRSIQSNQSYLHHPEEVLFESAHFTALNGNTIDYRFLSPELPDPGSDTLYPLVLFLHGAGERGNDNASQLRLIVAKFASDQIRAAYPCYVVAPQCPADTKWVDTDWFASEHTMPEEPSWPLETAVELVNHFTETYPIDSNRIYGIGVSMGGFGIWDTLQRYPNLFAGAIPICGGGDCKLVSRFAHIPLWVFHGADDTVVQTKRSRDMVSALKIAGANPIYTEFPQVGHNSWDYAIKEPAFFSWLYSQRKAG